MSEQDAQPARSSRATRWRRIALFIVFWAVAAYLVVPMLWDAYYSRNPDYASAPHLTHTGDKHPGDPVNLALVGTQAQVNAAMKAKGIVISAGYGKLKDSTIRIGHMGEHTVAELDRVLAALEEVLTS